MSKPSGIRNSALAMTASILTVISAFVTYGFVSRRLGVNTFGVWALTSAALFPLRFADLSINSAVLRYLGVADGRGLRRLVGKVVGLAMATNLLAFSICALIAWLTAPRILSGTLSAHILPQGMALIPYLMVASLTQLVAGVLLNAALGLHRYAAVYCVNIVSALIQIALVYPLLSGFGIAGYAILQTLTFAMQGLAGAMLLLTHADPVGEEEVEPFRARKFFAFAFQLNINALLSTLMEPLAKILLGRFWVLSAVGLYEMVVRVFAQLRTILLAPTQPLAVSMIRDRQRDGAAFQRTYQICLLYCLVIVGLVMAGSVPGYFLLQVALSVHDSALPYVMICVTLSFAISFMAVPAYHISIAASDVRPLLISTLSYLVVTAVAGVAFGLVWPAGTLLGILLGYIVANVLLIMAVARWHGTPAIPRHHDLAERWHEGVAMINQLLRKKPITP
jgi:O-antigen/teichoic acid export membrane protein